MTVYLGGWDHLLPDPVTMDTEELHAVAVVYELKSEWFAENQPERFPHYLVFGRTRRAAMVSGGVPIIDERVWMRRYYEARGYPDSEIGALSAGGVSKGWRVK